MAASKRSSICLLILTLRNTAAYPDILETTVIDENNKEIKLKWMKTQRSFLANQNLPIRNIWGKAKLEKYFLDIKAKNNYIDYTAYHDLDTFSAVIYIKKLQCLIGVIDTRYSIECLPISLLDRKYHIVKDRTDGYIFQTNSDHCDSSCYMDPSALFRSQYGETNPQFAPNLDLSQLTDTNWKERPSTSFNPDSSLPHGPDFTINPSFPNSESIIIHNDEASSRLSPTTNVASELKDSHLSTVLSQFENSASYLPSDFASSANSPPRLNDFDTALSDKHKSSNYFPSLGYIDDPLYNSEFLNVDFDDTFFQSKQNSELPELTDVDLEMGLPSVPDSVPSPAPDSDPSIDPPSSYSNHDVPQSSDSTIINHDETPSLLNPQSSTNLDFSVLTDVVNERLFPFTFDMDSPPNKRPRIKKRSDEKRLDTLYPEILIYVSNDMIRYEKGLHAINTYIPWIIYRFIAYFNAVDMLFAQLEKHGINIHLNIAGILFEKTRFSTQDHLHVMDEPLNHIQQLIRASQRSINADSATSNEGDHNYGFSTERFSAFDQKLHKIPKDKMKYAGSVIEHQKHMQNYVVAAREIAYLMEVDYETTENSFGNDAQCQGIMQKHNIRCLKWSDKSIESFNKYL
ncbi:hypothetical protein PV325_008761, partial [Microctonus aethiopoides]